VPTSDSVRGESICDIGQVTYDRADVWVLTCIAVFTSPVKTALRSSADLASRTFTSTGSLSAMARPTRMNQNHHHIQDARRRVFYRPALRQLALRSILAHLRPRSVQHASRPNNPVSPIFDQTSRTCTYGVNSNS
jgi:hypothetical protein